MDSSKNEELGRAAIGEVVKGMEVVGKGIDNLTSSSLKRVLKTITHVHLAEAMVNNHTTELSEEEQQLIDQIFALQEAVMGYTQLKMELEGASNE